MLCLTIFHWLEFLLPLSMSCIVISLGIMLKRASLLVVGSVLGVVIGLVMIVNMKVFEDHLRGNECTPSWLYNRIPRPELIQELLGTRCLCPELFVTGGQKDGVTWASMGRSASATTSA